MTDQHLLEEFDALALHEKMILALLAIVGEPVGKHAVYEHLQRADIVEPDGTPFTLAVVTGMLQRLARLALVTEVVGRGFTCEAKLRWPAMREAIEHLHFRDLCQAIETINPVRRNWDGYVELRSYRQGVARLRIALLRNDERSQVASLLTACMTCYEAQQLHPLIEICGRPFEPAMLPYIVPQLQDEILAVLLANAPREPATAPAIRSYARAHFAAQTAAGDWITASLPLALAEDAILCGDLEQAARYLAGQEGAQTLLIDSTIAVLRGEHAQALAGFEAALKALRKETGKRKLLFTGIGGHLYMLALLKSGDAKHLKTAETYLDIALHAQPNHDSAVYQQLQMLRMVRAGVMQADVVQTRHWETALQAQLFQGLLYYWLSLPQLAERQPQLAALVSQADAAGYELIAAQAAGVLGLLGDPAMERHATVKRAQHGLTDMAPWFERQEAWQRQLDRKSVV